MSGTMTTDCKIPYNKVTNKILQRANHANKGELGWKDNFIFNDVLTFLGWARGSEAVMFSFKDSFDTEYNMFMVDFCDLIKDAVIENGEVEGKWTFVKRSVDYGVKFVK